MAYQHLSRKERRKIALLHRQRASVRGIAQQLGRSPSTVSRELRRNKEGKFYRADRAQLLYIARREACCRSTLYTNEMIRSYVSEKLILTWSPEQIAGRMKLNQMEQTVSFSSIYRWLNKGLLPRSMQLKERLRRFRRRKKRRGSVCRADAKSIAARAKEVLRRSRYGDWEVDTISFGMFPNQRYLMNINERKSKYCALVLLRNIKRGEVLRAFGLFFNEGKLPLTTMTSDRGMEFNCHNDFESAFKASYYYTDKGKPWQKPTVENTNGLIRQFLPRGTKIEQVPADQIQGIMDLLNNRPRKSLGFKTPAEVLRLT